MEWPRLADLPDATSTLTADEREDMALLFEYELCEECGDDLADHKIVRGPFGKPLAACLKGES